MVQVVARDLLQRRIAVDGSVALPQPQVAAAHTRPGRSHLPLRREVQGQVVGAGVAGLPPAAFQAEGE